MTQRFTFTVDDPKSAGCVLNSDLEYNQYLGKTMGHYSLLIKTRNKHLNLYFKENQIQEMSTHKHLKLNFSNNGHWIQHIDHIV